jgi:glycosyltransferase involved in cell wall biosynthesis
LRDSPVIVTVLTSHVPSGGFETGLYHLIVGLDRTRFQPRLVCLHRDPGFVARELEGYGIPLVSGLSYGKFDPLVGHRLVRTLGARVDILLCLDHHDVLFWTPYVLRFIDVHVCVVTCHSTRDPHGRRVFRLTDRLALRCMQRIIAVAHGHKRYLLAEEGLAPERLEVIHNGIPVPEVPDPGVQNAERAQIRQSWGLTDQHRVAVILAHLRPEKNHRRFLRIAKTVAVRLPEARFVIVGEGPERAALERYAHELGVTAVVQFVGFVGDRQEVQRLLRAADVVTLTSDERVETFSFALLEGMAVGRPIVATRVGSLDEMVIEGETGHLIPVENEAAFADALSRLLADRVTAAAMGEAGRRVVRQRFTADQMVRAYERLFEQLLQEVSVRPQ